MKIENKIMAAQVLLESVRDSANLYEAMCEEKEAYMLDDWQGVPKEHSRYSMADRIKVVRHLLLEVEKEIITQNP